MSCTPVLSKKVTATGTAIAHRTRVRAISFKPAAAGSIILKDGSSGATLLDLDVDTGSTTYLQLPADGILFQTEVHATLSVVSSLTLIYG